MRKQRRVLGSLGVAAVILAGCGDSGDSTTTATTTGSPTTAAPTTAAPTTTRAAAPATTGGAATTAPASGNTVEVSIPDRQVVAPTSLKAGAISFAVTNPGRADHELVVVRGTYATLPKQANGAVIEDQLPAGTLLGRTAKLAAGGKETLNLTLTPGQYVLVCNIVSGPNSHAGAGQRLDVTVA